MSRLKTAHLTSQQARYVLQLSPSAADRRAQSTISATPLKTTSASLGERAPPLSVMPLGLLLRSLMITSVLSSKRLVDFSMPIMKRLVASKSAVLSCDRNPALRFIMRKVIYDHFAAGECKHEVRKTVATMKHMGFKGVILGHAKDVVVDHNAQNESAAIKDGIGDAFDPAVEKWKEGQLETVRMLTGDDILAIKFTGGGPAVIEALTSGAPPPPAMQLALKEICDLANLQDTRIWIDAEQQIFQDAIDAWTLDLMRQYNRSGRAMIYNTFQAYLKRTPENLASHLRLAQREGWALGIKLVRGAYIASERRELIHDTIDDTHAVYNGIAADLINQSFPGLDKAKAYPVTQLMLAGHNAESVEAGYALQKRRVEAGQPTILLEFGQLQGMADEISCELLQLGRTVREGNKHAQNSSLAPRAYKCLAWGSTQECLAFLLRRAVENRDAVARTKTWVAAFRRELWRRTKKMVFLA